ncbi:MAG TPA: porin family protein [Rhabdaerophilum sp.]|nr:porin family protein [Rhabdaerophilum sp.]
MQRLFKSVLPLAIAIGSISFAMQARAADLPGRGNVRSVPMMASNWAGFYAGAHLGYGFGRSRTADISGFLGGIQAGYNIQSGQMVYGIEGDLGYGNVNYRAFAETFRQKWIGSGRARIGYAFDRFLPFVTGGVAFSNGTMKAGGAKESNGHVGYVIGIGGEMMLTDRVSASLQLLHYRFAAQTYNVLPAARNANIVTNELRVGLNYRF